MVISTGLLLLRLSVLVPLSVCKEPVFVSIPQVKRNLSPLRLSVMSVSFFFVWTGGQANGSPMSILVKVTPIPFSSAEDVF